ncbi:MAG: polyribonucleotide nucleotidyltransferase [Dehalococcoidia bacterium]
MAERFERTIGDQTLSLEVGELANLANGAVTLRYGDTVLLATACISEKPREGMDFFPLTVDFEERLYAIGKIPGSFFRREGRPSTDAILSCRLTDRPIRPLFPKGFRNDVQVIITVLSSDRENIPDVLGTVGASAALSISGAPFAGPVSSVRVGYVDGEFVLNPTYARLDESELDLIIAGTRDAIMMVEAGALQVPEDIVLKAMEFGQRANQELISLQDELVAKVGAPQIAFEAGPAHTNVQDAVRAAMEGHLEDLLTEVRSERQGGLEPRRQELLERFGDEFGADEIGAALDAVVKDAVRSSILDRGVRPDGRGPAEIRPLSAKVGILPRTHGSGLFTRGETQVLTIATLGSSGEQQRLDNISPEERKRFMHHYNFPPFSVGEARPLRGASRREVGHGALAERAVEAVVPDEETFPYTIRLVSEVLSSNGSTSMASVCGSTLALLDAGVPIEAPVGGIAMGLVMGQDGKYAILTDIAGVEDALGDMDFKVAGSRTGITALQMDIKVKGITLEIMEKALAQARDARMAILDVMQQTMPEHRAELSKWAPRMYRVQIPVEKIGTLIGPGGRVIRSIIEETKCSIDVEDDGTVFIGSAVEEQARKAMEIIEGLTKDVEVGDIFTGKVTRIVDFGAFVEIPGGKDGLVRIGELAEERIDRVEDVVEMGEEIMVKVIEVDSMGRINLSRRALLTGEDSPREGETAAAPRQEGPPRGERPSGGGDRPSGGGDRGRFGDRPPRRPDDRGGRGFGGGGGGGAGRGGFGGGRGNGGAGRRGGGGGPGGPGGGGGRRRGGGRPPSNRPGPSMGPGPIRS